MGLAGASLDTGSGGVVVGCVVIRVVGLCTGTWGDGGKLSASPTCMGV